MELRLKVKLEDRIKLLIDTAVLDQDIDLLTTSLTLELKEKAGQVILIELEDANARAGLGCFDYGGFYPTRIERYL
jgi:hypothetical protein